MPLTSPKRRISDAEYRLRVLCCVNALGMATLEQLWPFVAQLELMDYMPLCVFVDELKKDGALDSGSHAIQGSLYLTEKGRRTLALFSERLPRADRERIEKAAPAYCARLNERLKVRAAHERSEDGESRVACTVREGDVPTLFLRILTRQRPLASAAMKRFRLCASHLMLLLYTLPCGGGDAPAVETAETLELAMKTAAPGRPMLCAYGKHEHSAVVCLRDTAATYVVALLMPGREAAARWASAALAEEGRLAAKITAALLSGGGN